MFGFFWGVEGFLFIEFVESPAIFIRGEFRGEMRSHLANVFPVDALEERVGLYFFYAPNPESVLGIAE